MTDFRRIARTFVSQPTLEGAGVRLHRAFGFAEAPLFDPFLLLDDFSSERPEDYLAGSPLSPASGWLLFWAYAIYCAGVRIRPDRNPREKMP